MAARRPAERGVVRRVSKVEGADEVEVRVEHVTTQEREIARGRDLGHAAAHRLAAHDGVGGHVVDEALGGASEADALRIPRDIHGIAAAARRRAEGEGGEGVLDAAADVVADEPVAVHVEKDVGVDGVPVDLLEVGGVDGEALDELVGLAVVELVARAHPVEDETSLVGVPRGDRGVHRLETAARRHRGDPPDGGTELGVGHGLAQRRLREGRHGVPGLVGHEAGAEVLGRRGRSEARETHGEECDEGATEGELWLHGGFLSPFSGQRRPESIGRDAGSCVQRLARTATAPAREGPGNFYARPRVALPE